MVADSSSDDERKEYPSTTPYSNLIDITDTTTATDTATKPLTAGSTAATADKPVATKQLLNPASAPTASDKKATPLPRSQVLIIGLILYAATFPQNVLFPFLPFMVAFFNPELSTSQLGYRAGVIAAAFSVGTFFSSYIFGRLADRYGRKGCVLVGLLGTVVSSLMFGLSTNFGMAVTARLLAGLLCGNNGLASQLSSHIPHNVVNVVYQLCLIVLYLSCVVSASETMISEITDDTNSALAFAMVGMMDGLARLSAPSIGGWLSEPNRQYNWGVAFLDQFPFFIPCFFSAAISFIAIFFVIPLQRETLPQSIRVANTRRLIRQMHSKQHASLPLSVRLADEAEEKDEAAIRKRKSVWVLIRQKEIGVMVALNAILMVLALVINEGLPLWVVNDEAHFGFNFDSSHIGIVFTILGPMQALSSLFIYPPIAKRFGFIATFKYCLFMVGIFSFLLPFTYYVRGSSAAVWTCLVGGFVLLVMHRSSAFTTCFVMLNNVCTDEQKASANGLAMSVASAAGIVSPVIGGSLLAWSIDAGLVWPLDHSLMWVFCSVVSWLGVWLVGRMPLSANKKLSEHAKAAEVARQQAALREAVELGHVNGHVNGHSAMGAAEELAAGQASTANGVVH